MKLTLAAAALVGAGTACATHDRIVEHLATKFGEVVQSRAITQQGHMFEVFVSHETGTWSAVMTNPNGFACMVSAGQGFENVALLPDPAGEDL